VFGEHLAFNGTSAAFGAGDEFEFVEAKTPVVDFVTPPTGMAGTQITLVGSNLDAAFAVADPFWYMDEFGFYETYQVCGGARHVFLYSLRTGLWGDPPL
jgi:hypothetical protein